MRAMHARSRRPRDLDRFWAFLLLVPPLLLLPSLGDGWLWQDEAQTALLARSVLQHGVPVARQGDVLLTEQPDAADVSSDGLWIWSPWLPFYLVAGSFAVFGESTASARLPFALAAWATLLLGYACFRELTGDRRVARLAIVLLGLSVPFLLLARQSRYYAICALLGVAFVHAYLRLPARGARLGLFASALGLAGSFPPQLVMSLGATGAHALLVRRDGRRLRDLGLVVGTALAVSLPFFLYARFWSRDYRGVGYAGESLLRYAMVLRTYLIEIHLYAWPFLLGLPLAWRAARRAPDPWRTALRGALVAGTVVWLFAVVAPPTAATLHAVFLTTVAGALAVVVALVRRARAGSASADWASLVAFLCSGMFALFVLAPFPFFRYLAGLLPFFALASAATFVGLAPRRPALAWGLVALVVSFDGLALFPFFATDFTLRAAGRVVPVSTRPANADLAALLLRQQGDGPRVRSLAWEYLGELRSDYAGPVERAVTYLRAHAEPDDVVLTRYEHFTLLFYTDFRVARLDEAAQLDEPPDWIFMHGNTQVPLPDELVRSWRRDYVRVPVRGYDFPWENIPEPYWHRFRSPDRGPPIRLLRRRADAEPEHDAPQ